ncbi:MAG: monovalent cation/H(+) antiporter subunit G [Opitutales bacterium]
MIYVASFFLLLGSIFALIAAIGVVRMPDLYCRMHAATKAGAFGVSLMLLGVVLLMPSLRIIIQSVMIVAFFYMTAPLAGHMIGRVALKKKLPMWQPIEVKSLRNQTPKENLSLLSERDRV